MTSAAASTSEWLCRSNVVDATGSGSQFGLRGQVLKVTVNGISTVADVLFDGVR